MAKYRCRDCGEVFDESEIVVRYEDRGEFWGFPSVEEIAVCPYCRQDDLEKYDESEESEDEDERIIYAV